MKTKFMNTGKGTVEDPIIWTINTQYLSEDKRFEKLPIGYINKQVCGCGATSVVLENDYNTIIAVHTIQLIKNKTSETNKKPKYDILGVYGETSDNEIKEYVNRCKVNKVPFKIMVTYDSVERVKEYLYRDPYGNQSTQFIIDEAEQVVKTSLMKARNKRKEDVCKKDRITKLLDIAREYKDITTFITASDFDKRLYDDWMITDITHHQFRFTNTRAITTLEMLRDDPIKYLKLEIILPIRDKGYTVLNKHKFEKVIVFYNNIVDIVDLVRSLGIKEESGIICADTNENKEKLKGLEFITDYKNLPKYTFVTQTGWQGIDLYDNKAMNICVSNAARVWQLMDIDTDVKQAIARQRDTSNPNYYKYVLIYNDPSTYYDKEQLDEKIKVCINTLYDNISLLNNTPNIKIRLSAEQTFSSNSDFLAFVLKDDKNNYYINKRAVLYQTELRKKCYDDMKNGIRMIENERLVEPVSLPIEHSTVVSYDRIYDLYTTQLKYGSVDWYDIQLECEAYKLINECYKKFGTIYKSEQYATEKLQTLNEVKEDIPEMRTAILNRFRTGNEYLKADVKKYLQNIYNKYNYKRTAQFRDLNKFGIEFEEKYVDRKRGLKITRKITKINK